MGVFTRDDLVRDQKAFRGPVMKVDLTGKVVIVTGANSGIGFEVAKHFATMNPAKLVMACRSQTTGEEALQKLQKDTGFDRVELRVVDFGSFASVKSFADKFNDEVDRLDILIENAGMSNGQYVLTEDGWESGIQINNLAPQLLALLLLPKLVYTANTFKVSPRVTIVCSEVHHWATLTDETIRSPNIHRLISSKEYHDANHHDVRTAAYNIQKLFNVLFAREFQQHVPTSFPLIVDTVNPGYCVSSLRRNLTQAQIAVLEEMDKEFGLTPEQGSRTIVWAAVAHDGEPTLRGEYINISAVGEPSDWVLSPIGGEAQRKVWKEMVEILGQVDGRVTEIVAEHLV